MSAGSIVLINKVVVYDPIWMTQKRGGGGAEVAGIKREGKRYREKERKSTHPADYADYI